MRTTQHACAQTKIVLGALRCGGLWNQPNHVTFPVLFNPLAPRKTKLDILDAIFYQVKFKLNPIAILGLISILVL